MKNLKSLLSVILSIILIIGIIPVGTLAASEFEISGGVLTKYNGTGGNVVIPQNVTKIGYRAFADCTGLTSLTISNPATEFDDNAFDRCTGLTSINFPEGMTEIGDRAFSRCSGLTSLVFPSSLRKIGYGAFLGCTGLTSLTFPEGMTEIGTGFDECTGLTSINFPKSVTKIASAAFYGCTGLTGVVIPDTVTEIGDRAFSRCSGLTTITIPSSVTKFGLLVFDYTPNLTIYGSANSAAETYAKKRKIVFVAGPAPSVPVPITSIAYASTQEIAIDFTRNVGFPMYALKDAAGGVTNYIKLRDLAYVLNGTEAQYNVGWDNAINITPKTPYTSPNGTEMKNPFSGNRPYTVNTAPIKINGKQVHLDAIVLTDTAGGQYTYFKLRDLGKALGFNVGWIQGGVYIETNKPYIG